MANVKLDNIKKSFGSVNVLKGIELDIKHGEFIVLLGPSGCGKSTLLRIIAGLEDQSSGSILINDEIVDVMPPAKRGIAMVFQSYALYPHLTVAGNWGLGLKQAGEKTAEIERRTNEAARILDLHDLLDRKPSELSGGQRQRVAIGRAIVRKPDVFLFDEPLSNLDAALRSQVRVELARLHKDLKTTMIYVTHDQVEAMTLADRIVVMHDGIIQQVGTPRELYETPASLFVAGFIGSPKMNRIEGTSDGKNINLGKAGSVPLPAGQTVTGNVTLGLRPAGLRAVNAGSNACLEGTIILNEYLGRESYLHVELTDGSQIVVEVDTETRLESGEKIFLEVDPLAINLFDTASGARL